MRRFVAWAVIVACCVIVAQTTVTSWRGSPARPPRPGAVAQVERLYACVTPAGAITRVHAYRIACAEADQTVTWKVSAP